VLEDLARLASPYERERVARAAGRSAGLARARHAKSAIPAFASGAGSAQVEGMVSTEIEIRTSEVAPTGTSLRPALIEPVAATLRDGTAVVIRGIHAADRDRLISLFKRMSPISVRHRFFAAKRELTDGDLELLIGDGATDVGLAVFARGDTTETFVGTGRYVLLGDPPDAAEVAFEVADAEQGHGIGTLLLDHLARIARTRGITCFRAEVEADNPAMLDVFAHSGFTERAIRSRGLCRVEMAIAESSEHIVAATARAGTAATAAKARTSS
jgi:GNAT superfamily N-acetyltransferase